MSCVPDEDSNIHIIDNESKYTKSLVVDEVILNKLNGITSGRYLIGNYLFSTESEDGSISIEAYRYAKN